MCEADARVSRCAFDNGAAGFQLPGFFGIEHDVEGGAVFDAAARVLEFGFAEDGAGGLLGEVVEADEGRVANGWGGGGC